MKGQKREKLFQEKNIVIVLLLLLEHCNCITIRTL